MVKKNILVCPMCDNSDVKNITHESHFDYKGVAYSISNLNSAECKKCGFQFVSQEQKLLNEKLIREKRREIDNFLTAEQIKKLREFLQLSQKDAALIFGGGKHGFSKYERGEVVQSFAMDRLMRVAYEIPEVIDVIAGFSASGKSVSLVKNIDGQFFEMEETVSDSPEPVISSSSIKKERELEVDINCVVDAA